MFFNVVNVHIKVKLSHVFCLFMLACFEYSLCVADFAIFCVLRCLNDFA